MALCLPRLGLLLHLLCLLLLPLPAVVIAAAPPLLRHFDDARGMTAEQLDALFKNATIEGGIPLKYARGYPIVDPAHPHLQTLASNHWHGKHFEVLSDGGPQRGVVFNYLTLLPRDEKAFVQEFPGVLSIGRLSDVHPPLRALEVDDKPSVIIDYWYRQAVDELRLVNAKERIYLGRATNWFEEPRYIIAHFVLQFLDVPFAYEINYHEHIHMYLRDETFEAAGVPGGDPDPRFIQERRGVRREPRSPRPPTLR